MITNWIADENWNPVPCRDLFRWAEWFEKTDRTIERTEIMEVAVSTVFLGTGHCSPKLDGPTTYDFLFETMVFGPNEVIRQLTESTVNDISSVIAKVLGGNDIQVRYRTVAEARAGHKAMVDFVRRTLATRN